MPNLILIGYIKSDRPFHKYSLQYYITFIFSHFHIYDLLSNRILPKSFTFKWVRNYSVPCTFGSQMFVLRQIDYQIEISLLVYQVMKGFSVQFTHFWTRMLE